MLRAPHRPFGLGVVALLLVSANAAAQETPTPITSSQFDAIAAGEVLVDTERGDINRGQVIGLVNAPVDEIATIVGDSDTHDQWFPDTVESSASSTGANSSVTTGRTHLPIVRDRYWRIEGEHTQVTFDGISCELMTYAYDDSYEEGNMDELFGYWLLCPSGEGTAVKYVINADLGVWLPPAIVNWAQRRLLPGIIEELQARHDAIY